MMKILAPLFLSLSVLTSVSTYAADNEAVPALELYVSPISIGGKWGGDVNAGNLYKSFRGTLGVKLSDTHFQPSDELIERYVDKVLMPSDPDIRALNENPALDSDWKNKLSVLRAEKRQMYLDALRSKYYVPAPAAPAPAPVAAPAPVVKPVSYKAPSSPVAPSLRASSQVEVSTNYAKNAKK